MEYKITHTTVYTYSETVPVCHNEVHLTPRESPRQQRLASRLIVSPQPAMVQTALDYFGNPVSFFTIESGHDRLTVTATSRARVSQPAELPKSDSAWETIRDRLTSERSPPFMEANQFLFDSPHVQCSASLRKLGEESFSRGRPWLESLLHLTGRIYREFRYDKTATTVSTPLDDVLRHRSGVCQDFAHLEIGCLRSLGLAARYVSGYLVTKPPPGRPRLVGADASHAWLSAYSPDFGWIDVDPTNNQLPTTEHITLAWGRDYGDVAPIKGVFIGGGQHGMTVSVDVEPLVEKVA